MLVSSGMSSSRSSCVSGRWLFKFSRSSCVSGRWLFHFLFLPSCALSALWGCLGPSPWLFVIEVRASHRWLFMKLLISLSTIYIYIIWNLSMQHVTCSTSSLALPLKLGGREATLEPVCHRGTGILRSRAQGARCWKTPSYIKFTEAVLLLLVHCIVLALFGASNTSAGSIWVRHW